MYNISHIKHIFYINRNENILNIKPTDIIPTVTIATNTIISFLFTAFDSIIIDGKDNVVTALLKNIYNYSLTVLHRHIIINDKTVPSPAPFNNRLSATGIVPNISAYIGTPTTVASGTE